MGQAIIDLDEILGSVKQVRLGGSTYTLPGDLPVELYLRITSAAGQDLSEAEMVKALYDELLELFRYGDPTIDRLPLGVKHLMDVIPTIYGAESEARPTRSKTTTRGGNGASRASGNRPRARSRS